MHIRQPLIPKDKVNYMTKDIYKKFHKLYVVGQTDVGKKRTLNEDNFYIDEKINLMLVADGMGGHQAGELASSEVVNTIRSFLRHEQENFTNENDITVSLDLVEPTPVIANFGDDSSQDDEGDLALNNLSTVRKIKRAVAEANHRVFSINQERGNAEGYGMGTTVVGMWYDDILEQAVVFHVGDSRLYRYRDGVLTQVTKDHSLYQAWLDAGSIGDSPRRNIILRALGPSSEVDSDVKLETLQPKDVFMICSDGLTGHLEDDEIAKYLERVEMSNIDEVCNEMITECNIRGGKDNITVVIGYYPE